MSPKKPRILLVGAGKFGEKHLKTLLFLEKKGLCSVSGVVVKGKESAARLRAQYRFPVYQALTTALLESVDAVDIVTPPETHVALVLQCLPLVHVFVEKPLATTEPDALLLKKVAPRFAHVLMVGHIYRYHPLVRHLKKLIKKIKGSPQTISGEFVNPVATDNGRDVELEFPHLFDIADYVFEKKVVNKFVETVGRMKKVSLRYSGNLYAVFTLGWQGAVKKRTLKLVFQNQSILCDLEKNIINIYQRGEIVKTFTFPDTPSPLELELRAFVNAACFKKESYPDVKTGHRIVAIATRNSPVEHGQKKKKRVAVIGAGIFGTNVAIELAPFFDVTLFDKNDDILTEASFINQYRHHWGYHYPRSQETIHDILAAIDDFEERYQSAIIREFPTYYGVAKEGSKVTAEQYLNFCDRNKLPYTLEYPDPEFFAREKSSICLKTFEPIYNFKKLKAITARLLKERKIKLRFAHEVIGAHIELDGKKILKIKGKKSIREESFDYVINVTYARYNHFCRWLGFPIKPIRLDLVEALWVKLNIPKISLAVMDGKFTNMVPTGIDNVFTLVHIKDSVLRRFVPRNGLIPKDIFTSIKQSRVKRVMRRSIEWFPVLKRAEILKKLYVLRGVNAYREHDDARTSDIADHGFGCVSILGGKIINSVSSARAILRLLSNLEAPSR